MRLLYSVPGPSQWEIENYQIPENWRITKIVPKEIVPKQIVPKEIIPKEIVHDAPKREKDKHSIKNITKEIKKKESTIISLLIVNAVETIKVAKLLFSEFRYSQFSKF